MVNLAIRNFTLGNVVYLLSNTDSRMIIERIDTERNVIICGWIGEDGELFSREFKPYQLGKVI
ncbi:MAG: hypothetical protein PF484_06295 [Bacteroidales bacterium]|jgi:hypothetical protein|nr:hypothetical protein [Bacteroidales bacterium]